MPHQEHPEYGLQELLEPHDRFGRWLAVAIVATTLAGALVAFLQARSVHQHDEAGSRSEQWAALGSSVRGRSERAARLQIARARMAHRDRVRAEQADGRRIFAPDGDERALAGEARVWRKLAAQVSRTSNDLAGSLSAE